MPNVPDGVGVSKHDVKAIDILGHFARVVSDPGAARDVLALLADALFQHVSPDGVAVFAFGPSGTLSLAAERGVGEAAKIESDLDEVVTLPAKLLAACPDFIAHVNRPLAAGGNLYGDVVMFQKKGSTSDISAVLSLADGLIDLAAIALGTAAHVAQLERQFAELREQQEMLVRSEKLRALGQMAAGVSHDVKNILNPLSLHIQVIARSLDRGNIPEAKESAVEMKQILQRGLQTLERLRDFSRQSKESKTELVEIDKLAREAVAIGKARSASSGGGRVPRFVEEMGAPPAVMAIGSEIVSALVNLIVNAIDAMAEAPPSSRAGAGAGAGTITLCSGEDEKGVWIEVADDGPGMPPEVAKRVFEPFFTTKGQEGTGLGLAMVYATMQRHGGSVSIHTKPGEGTRFRLSLPASGPLSRG